MLFDCIIWLVIIVQEIVMCKLVIDSEINGKSDTTVVEGKGYHKIEGNEKTVYFTSDNVKYKYVYNDDELIVNCDDSQYVFKLNDEGVGKIKNGDYVFRITTFATRIEVSSRYIILEYNLSQQGNIIGRYKSKLSL